MSGCGEELLLCVEHRSGCVGEGENQAGGDCCRCAGTGLAGSKELSMSKLRIVFIVLFVALALDAQPRKMLTGAHFPSNGDFKTLKNLGYDFAVITLDPHNAATWKPALDAAEAAGIKLMAGGYPPPYLFDNVKWTITGSGMELLTYLQSRSSLILALYVFNEPYSTNPY